MAVLTRNLEARYPAERIYSACVQKHPFCTPQRDSDNRKRQERLDLLRHELRTPLSVVVGYNRLLLSELPGGLTPTQRNCVEQTIKSCNQLAALIEKGVVPSSQNPSPDVLLHKSQSLHPLFQYVRGMARQLKPALACKIHIECARDAESACFDRTGIEQVMTNLLTNALRHTPDEGQIWIRSRTLTLPEAPKIEVSVEDQGPGIPSWECDRIFEPGVCRENPGRVGESGLGLAICKQIIAEHGGQIWATPGPAGGSRFGFTLPPTEESLYR